ncbi:hypothetical protein GCM10009429_10780 [Dyella marensis]
MLEQVVPPNAKIDEAKSAAKAAANRQAVSRKAPVELYVFLVYSPTSADPWPSYYYSVSGIKDAPSHVYVGNVVSDPTH